MSDRGILAALQMIHSHSTRYLVVMPQDAVNVLHTPGVQEDGK